MEIPYIFLMTIGVGLGMYIVGFYEGKRNLKKQNIGNEKHE